MTKRKANPKKGGRPPKYDAGLHPGLAAALLVAGLIEKEVARMMQIDESLLSKWKVDHPEFLEALRDPKALVDKEVVSLLLKRARGFEVTETKFYEETTPAHQVMNREGLMVTIPAVTKTHKEVTKKQLAPNMSAIIFWLKNRQPNVWRDRQELTLPDVRAAFKSLAGPDIKALREAKAEVVDVEAEEIDTEDDAPDEGNL